jgi:hypothetical protein
LSKLVSSLPLSLWLKTGRLYFRENLRYWGQLFSGICIFLLIPPRPGGARWGHVWAFMVKSDVS